MSKYRKLIGTLLGGVTAGLVLVVASALGLTIPAALAGTVAVAISAIGTYLAKPNETDPFE